MGNGTLFQLINPYNLHEFINSHIETILLNSSKHIHDPDEKTEG